MSRSEEAKREYVSVYVPKEFAETVRKAHGDEEQYKVITDILAKSKHDMREDLAALDEDVLRFRGMLLAYKGAYTAALIEHNKAVYAVWEGVDAAMPDMKAKVAKLVGELREIRPELSSVVDTITAIDHSLASINTYRIREMVQLVEAITRTDDKTKDMLRAVLVKDKE
jgi:hypothetical protein